MNTTIAAIATPVGEGGIGIIRISGDKALDIANKIFTGKNKIEDHKLVYGFVIDGEKKLDEVLLVYMKAPKTYTAEDVVEIHCHGGVVSISNILDLVLKEGAVLAEPGEFTKRAFLNGRLDLSQAEAVIDLIKAKTTKSFDVAMNQLEGALSRKVEEIRGEIVNVLVNLTVNIDYPDEDIEEVTYEKLIADLSKIRGDVALLESTEKSGKILKDGVKVAIIGKPNVGKSSLLNNLLRENRAIVTEIPGTTRDTISEFINIRGIPVELIDTAGIRETDDVVEKIGIEKSKQSFNEADLVIFILDVSRPLDQEDKVILDNVDYEKTIFVFNKIDKPLVIDEHAQNDIKQGASFIRVSMNDIGSISLIEEKIYEAIKHSADIGENRAIITNARHLNALRAALSNLDDALMSAKSFNPLEFVEIDVSAAYEELGFISGESVKDDIISEVVSRFDVRKETSHALVPLWPHPVQL